MTGLADIGISNTDCLLSFDSIIMGEFADPAIIYPAIQILSFSWGATSNRTGAAATRVAFRDIEFTTTVSKASPRILHALVNNSRIREAVLHVRKQGTTQIEYYTITLGNVYVSSYESGVETVATSAIPVDRFTVNFSTINFEYAEQREDGGRGAVTSCAYDIARAPG
jgi:type VI secretion system secreted protein Hcp